VAQLQQNSDSKAEEVRTLQTALGEMKAETALLHEENDSKLSALDLYYRDVFEDTSDKCLQKSTTDKQASLLRQQVDLNITPPSEKALEGALVILTTMAASPVEFVSD
jgi:hypothetical protein